VRTVRILLLALLGVLLAAPPAESGDRLVARGFYGATWDRSARHAPEPVQEAQWALMARSGVESVRTVFSWTEAQPSADAPLSFTATDAAVARAARHGMRLLALVHGAPRWARLDPDTHGSAPRRSSDYAAYVGALVRRYGSSGSFWAEHPELPRRPVREWQLWNEPHLGIEWHAPPGSQAAWPRGYVRLLRESAGAVRSGDRRAKVVLGGLTNDSWNKLRQLYRLGARRLFDVVTMQTYTSSPGNIVLALGKVRAVMRRYRDGRKPLWATEVGWPAARGRTPVEAYARPWVTTDRVMARRLGEVYAMVARHRRDPRYRVGRVYWYSWATGYRPGDVFDFSGLLRFDGQRFTPRPALRYFRASARRHEGCAKTSRGTCRR